MPISLDVLKPRSAEAGKIKIGQVTGKKGAGKNPQKLESKQGPYFLITKTIRGEEDTNFVRDVALMKQLEQYADVDADGVKRLRRIPIMLDSDDIEQVAPTRLALYRGTNIFCAGTGGGKGDATRWEGDGRTDVSTRVDCPCDYLRSRGKDKCKPNLILWCTIIAGAETRLGVRHAFRTTGWNSIKSILAALETIRAQVGTICGIKLWLCVKWDLKKDATGTTRRIPVVHVECRTNDLPALRREAIANERTRLEVVQLRNPAVLALPIPAVNESKATQAAVAAEWFPTQEAEQDDDLHDDEDDLYDPETGVVYEDEAEDDAANDATGEPEQRQTQATQATQATGTEAEDRKRWQRRLGPMLKQLAELRELPATQESMIDVLSQLTTEAFGKSIPFGQLTLEQAGMIDAVVDAEIKKRQAEVWIP